MIHAHRLIGLLGTIRSRQPLWRATDARPFVIFTIALVPPMINVLTQLGDVGKNGLISHVQLVVDLH